MDPKCLHESSLLEGDPTQRRGQRGHMKTEVERTGMGSQTKEHQSCLKEAEIGSPLEHPEGQPADP